MRAAGGRRPTYSGLQDEDPAPPSLAAQPARTMPPTTPATEMTVAPRPQPAAGSAPIVAATPPLTPKKCPFRNVPPWRPRRVVIFFHFLLPSQRVSPPRRKNSQGRKREAARAKNHNRGPATVAVAQIGRLISLLIGLRALCRSVPQVRRPER